MADISKINVNSTTYNLKDSRLPNLNSSTTQYLRGDGTWAAPTVETMSGNVDVSDEGSYLLIEPGSGGGGSGAVTIEDTTDAAGGTVRTITAIEISGTKSITQNGTGIDVTSYAAVDVNVPSGEPTLQAKTNISPTTSSQTIQADSGYDGLSSVQINAMPSGSATTPTTTITATPSISVSSSGLITASVSGSQSVTPTVSAGYVSSGTAGTVSVSGSNTEQLSTQAAATITPSTSQQTAVAAGKYTTGAVVVSAMPSGTAGTPTATKGTVSNHSISVTPSVTNTTGYITGSTKTGTAVTVGASELVSGSETKTSNGTYDVTNLASLVINVPAGKNAQMQSMSKRTSSNTYTDMGFEITVAKAGKYDIYWTGYRSSTGGTNGAQIYVNDTAQGNAQTTFDGTYANCQNGHLSNVTLALNDKVTIRARARSSSYYMYIMNLVIIEA